MSTPLPASTPVPDKLDDLAKEITTHLAEIDRAMSHCLSRAFAVGELLNKAKAMSAHGNWGAWLRQRCGGLPERTAQRYMRLADNRQMIEAELKTKSANMADLTLRQAEQLITARPTAMVGSKSEPPKIIGGNDPVIVVQTAEEKLFKALKNLNSNDHEKAKTKAGDFVKRLKDADIL